MNFMKSVLLPSVVKLEEKELRNLCQQVKETVSVHLRNGRVHDDGPGQAVGGAASMRAV